MSYTQHEFKELLGKTLVNIENRDDEVLIFTTDTGDRYQLYHSQDCCESVTIEEIVGELDDLLNIPILQAEESTSDEAPPGDDGYHDDCTQWTFYKLATIKGYVTIRWFGESNGYYSVDVSFDKV